MTDPILIALREAAVEVHFRLEDCLHGSLAPEQSGICLVASVAGTLSKVRAAIELRERELRSTSAT